MYSAANLIAGIIVTVLIPAKGAVAADGPQMLTRVQINKAMVGFLTHSGYSHGRQRLSRNGVPTGAVQDETCADAPEV